MKYAAFILMAVSSTALAGDEETPNVKYQAVTEIDMVDVNLQADMVKPSIAEIGEAKRPRFAPMIQLREHFHKEMRESLSTIQ